MKYKIELTSKFKKEAKNLLKNMFHSRRKFLGWVKN